MTPALLRVSFVKPPASLSFLVSIPRDETSMTPSVDPFSTARAHGKHVLTCLLGSTFSSGHKRHTDGHRSLLGSRELTTQQKREANKHAVV